MANSEKSNNITRMGECIVNALRSQGPDVDPLSNWMAFYLAEKIKISESAKGAAKEQAQKECFETVLKLWKHRNQMPKHVRPLRDIEAISRALKRLDPEFTESFYPLNFSLDEEAPDGVSKLVECIIATDKAARALITCLLEAAQEASSDSEILEILQSCQNEFKDKNAEVDLMIFKKLEDIKASSPTDAAIQKLNGFIEICTSVIRDLEEADQSTP